MHHAGAFFVNMCRRDSFERIKQGNDTHANALALTYIKRGSCQGNDVRALGLELKRDSKQGGDVHALRLESSRRIMCGLEAKPRFQPGE